jgi:hypothetical protein
LLTFCFKGKLAAEKEDSSLAANDSSNLLGYPASLLPV